MPKLSPTAADGAESKANDYLYWAFVLIGCGIRLPWNALLSAIDYFDDVYPDYDALRWISLTYMSVRVLAVIFNSFVPTNDKGKTRILLGLGMLTTLMALIPTIDLAMIQDEHGTNLTFALLMACVVVLTVVGGITVGSLVGLTMYLPPQYCQGYLTGSGASAVVIVALRAITKAIFTDSTNGLRLSAYLFFFLSSGICLACVLAQKLIVMDKSRFQHQTAADEELLLPTPRVPAQGSLSRVTLGDFVRVASKMRMANLNVVVNAATTLTIFPGVPSDVKSDALGDWYGVMLVAIFAVADFVSRLPPVDYVLTNPRLVTALNIARMALIPITFAAVHLFSNPVSISLLILIHGLASGYLFLCCFAMGQEKMQGKEESFVGGNILMTLTIFGYSLGSGFSMAWSKLG